jgi:hypothetical protein
VKQTSFRNKLFVVAPLPSPVHGFSSGEEQKYSQPGEVQLMNEPFDKVLHDDACTVCSVRGFRQIGENYTTLRVINDSAKATLFSLLNPAL